MKFHFRIAPLKNGFFADCIELENLYVQSITKETLIQYMNDALAEYLTQPGNPKKIFPKPNYKLKGPNIFAVPVESNIAWAFLLKNARLTRKLSQQEVATALSMKNIYAYQRLESAKTANPALSTIAKIKKIFPELDLEEILDT